MMSKPELPSLARDMEIKHVFNRMAPHKPRKAHESRREVKDVPVHER